MLGQLPRTGVEVSASPLPFVDWRFVDAGRTVWVDQTGASLPLWAMGMTITEEEVQPRQVRVPSGIRLAVQQAAKTEPVFAERLPWEEMLLYCTLLYDEGRYRLWYETMRPQNVLCYAESDDGMIWKRPQMQFETYAGNPTNIVLGRSVLGARSYHGGTVFKDPSAPAQERYKVLFMSREFSLAEAEDYLQRTGAVASLKQAEADSVHAICGAVSPDGLAWKLLPDPLLLHFSDTQTVCSYDPVRSAYTAYFRMWDHGRRCIGRAETQDFSHWPLPELAVVPQPHDEPYDDFYTNGCVSYPGRSDVHLMFSSVWHRDTDSTEVRLGVSEDNKLWSWAAKQPLAVTSRVNAWDGGCLFAGQGLVRRGNSMLVPYNGFRVPHKFPRAWPLGNIGFLTWEKDRIVALEAPERGTFTSMPLRLDGPGLVMNLLTERAGEVKVGLLDEHGAAIPGKGLADADPLAGDLPDGRLSWQGHQRLDALVGQTIRLQVQLRAAKLYSLRTAAE